ncbi:hypothetical protein DER46DRAFT_624358 [Fusarium sp. MPI-SDFR-AT-0072]|nr:hypothetical protein DER46DRAFT_624358 [Fusarium sp. MPI-SDFR-AT-0072]
MRRPVPLLPSPSKPAESQTAAVVTQTEIVLRKRKQPVSSACEECRKRKSKAENSRFQSVYSMLREKPEDVALAIFRRIRTGADPDAILSSMEDGDLLMQLHLAPSSQFRYTFPCRTHACHATPTVAYRNEHWNPQNIGYIFLAEARRLLELETGRSKITTVQAMLVMNITMNDHGVDSASYQYLTKAVALANLMGLFNSPSEYMEQDADQDIKVVREVTAWALFAWQGIMSSMFHEPPLVKEPPQTSYPDPVKFPFWYGDLWIRYPSSQEPISTKYHQTFKAYLEFWTIFNEIALVLFRPGKIRSLYLGQAVEFYARLRSWFDGLPDDLHPRKIVLPFQLKLHIQYWALLMDLFKPFAGWDDLTKALDKTPSEIYGDARRNQELVLRIYYLRHGTETHDCWLSMFLLKLGFLALQEVASSSDHDNSLSTLILALTSLDNQGKCYFMAEFTLRTICAKMSSRDLEIFKQFATFEDLDAPQAIASRISLIKSNWPVNMDFAKQERKNIRDVAAEAIGMDLTDDE